MGQIMWYKTLVEKGRWYKNILLLKSMQLFCSIIHRLDHTHDTSFNDAMYICIYIYGIYETNV